VTAGVYALTGFEVTPATVIGLLTILGFSLYDSVVVYDKVQENSKGLTSLLRRTYPESANLAVNQTIMRSLNTSLIALLPVAGLLVAGIAVLGGGTLKDLALVLLVGMLVGAYSSIFVAVPIAVDLKIREPVIRQHTARVLAKRRADGLIVDADGDPVGRKTLPGFQSARFSSGVVRAPNGGLKAGAAPKPGVKPQRPVRPVKGPKPATAPLKPIAARPAAAGSTPPAAGSTPLAAERTPLATGSTPLAAGSTPLAAASTPLAASDASHASASATRQPAAPADLGKASAGKPRRQSAKVARPTGKRGR